jgi:hypothetical protein
MLIHRAISVHNQLVQATSCEENCFDSRLMSVNRIRAASSNATTLEAYQIGTCSGYPILVTPRWRRSRLQTSSGAPALRWQISNQVTDCGHSSMPRERRKSWVTSQHSLLTRVILRNQGLSDCVSRADLQIFVWTSPTSE